MKKVLLVFATVWITVSGFAQKTADIGIWGGTSSYLGDFEEFTPFQTFNPNFGAYFRYNVNARVGIRAMFLTGSFAESGLVENTDWSFDKSVQDFSLQVEINYLKYILGNKNTRFTSYVTGGIGVAYLPYTVTNAEISAFNTVHPIVMAGSSFDDSEMSTTIPFGIGFKYSLGSRLGIGIEYQMRKLFSDKLDNLDDPQAWTNISTGEITTYTTTYHNNDWMMYAGVHLTYKIYLGKKACPVYESKVK